MSRRHQPGAYARADSRRRRTIPLARRRARPTDPACNSDLDGGRSGAERANPSGDSKLAFTRRPPIPPRPRRRPIRSNRGKGALNMALNISEPFIRHPIATSLLMVGILFIGIVAYPQLAGRAAAAGRFPDAASFRATSRRQPGNHGLLGGAAARDAIRADLRRLADDLGEHARLDGDHAAVRSQPQYRRRRRATCWRRSMPPADNCRKICPRRRPFERSIPPIRRFCCCSASSKSLPLTVVDDKVQTKLVQQISQIPGVAQVHDRRPADAGDPHPARPRQTGRQESVARGGSRAALRRDGRRPQRHDLQRQPRVHDLHQRSAHAGQSLERRHRRLPKRRAVARQRYRPGGRGSAGHDAGRPGPTANAPCSWSSSSSPAPT